MKVLEIIRHFASKHKVLVILILAYLIVYLITFYSEAILAVLFVCATYLHAVSIIPYLIFQFSPFLANAGIIFVIPLLIIVLRSIGNKRVRLFFLLISWLYLYNIIFLTNFIDDVFIAVKITSNLSIREIYDSAVDIYKNPDDYDDLGLNTLTLMILSLFLKICFISLLYFYGYNHSRSET